MSTPVNRRYGSDPRLLPTARQRNPKGPRLMSKRGERRPYRYRFTWPNGLTGVRSFPTREGRDFAAEQHARMIGANGARATIETLETRKDHDS